MTAAEKLRMEIAQEAPFSKDEFISKISRLIKAYGYALFATSIFEKPMYRLTVTRFVWYMNR